MNDRIDVEARIDEANQTARWADLQQLARELAAERDAALMDLEDAQNAERCHTCGAEMVEGQSPDECDVCLLCEARGERDAAHTTIGHLQKWVAELEAKLAQAETEKP